MLLLQILWKSVTCETACMNLFYFSNKHVRNPSGNLAIVALIAFLEKLLIFRFVRNLAIKGAHSNILEVLVACNKTENTDTSLMLPQVRAKFLIQQNMRSLYSFLLASADSATMIQTNLIGRVA